MPAGNEILAALQGTLEQRFGASARALDIEFKRKQKSIYRCRLNISSPDGPATWEVIAKTHRNAVVAEASFALQTRLFQTLFPAHSTDRIFVPEPYAVVRNWVLMEAVSGETLRSVYRQTGNADLPRLLARAALKLHRMPSLARQQGLGMQRRQERIQGRGAALSAARPDLRAQIEMVLDVSERLQAAWGVVPEMAIHGDFHWAQVLVSESGDAWLIDVAAERRGDGAVDIANCLAQLEKHRGEAWFTAFHDAFLDEYVRHAGPGVLPRILVYQSEGLLWLAAKYAAEEPDEKHLTADAMVDKACELVLQAKQLMTEQPPPSLSLPT